MSEDSERIELRVPARPEYVGVVRLTSAGIAGRLNLSYDDVEDLKIAIAEAATYTMQAAPRGGELLIEYAVDEAKLEIVVSGSGDGRPVPRARAGSALETDRALGLFLIKCLMDEADEVTAADGSRVRMVKYLHRSA